MVSYPLLKTDFVSYLMVLHSIVQSFSSKKLKIISLVLLVLPANTCGRDLLMLSLFVLCKYLVLRFISKPK